MASARHGMATRNHLFGTVVSATPTTRKLYYIRCCTSTASFPLPPPSKRKNYLRQKLLKTLNKPPPGIVTPTTPEIPAEDSASQGKEIEFGTEAPRVDEEKPAESTNPIVDSPASQGEDVEFGTEAPGDEEKPAEPRNPIVDSYNIKSSEEVEASGSDLNDSTTSSVEEAPRLGLRRALAPDAFKYGMYIAGLYLGYRAALLAFGGSDEERKRRTKNNEHTSGHDVGGQSGVVSGQPPFYLGDLEMEAKIAEIQIMAREAREQETKNAIDRESGVAGTEETDDEEGEVEEDNDDVDASFSGRSEVEKEVVGKLFSVSKKLDSTQASLMNKPRVSSENRARDPDVVDQKDERRKLEFRKSYKPRSKLTPKEPNRRPKGFGGSYTEKRSGEEGVGEVENQNGHVQGKRRVHLDDSDAAKSAEG